MEDRKREQEREELHRTIWNIANDLRGSVDGWDLIRSGYAVLPLYLREFFQLHQPRGVGSRGRRL